MYSKDEARLLMGEFWESFGNYTKFYSIKIGEPIKWMLYKTEIKGLELKFELEKKEVRVVLESNSKNEESRFDIFVELDKYRKIINEGFSESLIWMDEYEISPGKIVSRIYKELPEITYHNKDNWPKIFEFMASNMYLLQSNFEVIHDLFKDKFGK
ncbi:MAG: DUF4268 domain-containing protein [Salinivirgaceae bacterium]|nr:DUF4268 domain-containing protein [Salinivirgaceae bacterium]